MHLIRLDIDRKNSAAHLQVGPFGGGLNAVYAPIQGGSATMSRFVRSILFRGNYVNEVFETEEGESIDGSMQWVDSTGHVRMMSFAGGSAMLPGGFVNSPLHPSQKTLHVEDTDRIRGLGNIFWEGDEGDARWDELRGDILGMLFCSPLGSVSPEKLWWSASRLGVHSPARNELDEGYQRLKVEEQDILDRLRNADAVDHDRAWWALERDRILAEISHVEHSNQIPSQPTERTNQAIQTGLRERLSTIQIELTNLKSSLQDLIMAQANAAAEMNEQVSPSGDMDAFYNGKLNNVAFGRASSGRTFKVDYTNEIQRIKTRIDRLSVEQSDVESQLKNWVVPAAYSPNNRWDDAQLRQQLTHAEEMLKRWDRRSQWHRRLAEVQSHLRTRSPYRRTSEGSLIPLVEKYLRELTAGAARQLPPWAVEASYLRGHDMPVDFDAPSNAHGRDLYYDRRLPNTDSRQRRIVDLAMRLAIAESAVQRIGRIPFLFDNSIEVFRGEALEQILHVLAGFARDGRQILLATHDEFIARRIAAHGGTVSRMHEILRYARPRYVMDQNEYLGIHPVLNATSALPYSDSFSPSSISNRTLGSGDELIDINRQLSGWANEAEEVSWWHPYDSTPSFASSVNRFKPAPVGVRNGKYFLHLDSSVAEIPTVDNGLAARFQHAGVHRVGDLIRSTPDALSQVTRIDADSIYYLQCIAEMMTATPQLRAFDARVLVGCGITRSHMLRDLSPAQLVDRVDSYLHSADGHDLLRHASPYEVSRIRDWITSMRGASFRARNPRSNTQSIFARQPQASDRDSHRAQRGERTKSSLRAYEPKDPNERERDRNRSTPAVRTVVPRVVATSTSSENQSHWKFYLDVESNIVDAPSIGPKMASKLEAIGISTVEDLLASDAATIANQLGERAVDATTVTDWQDQAMFVCRVPNMRGHDAQLLVGAEVRTAEQLAASDLAQLTEKIVTFASSKAGLRILRGSAAPDQTEIGHWIHWAQNCRAVKAA